MRKTASLGRFLLVVIALFVSMSAAYGQTKVLHVGSFANITHSQALVGKAQGNFEKALGANVRVDWKTFNAGPSVMEALLAGQIDIAYVGPNPALTGYVRSNGEAVRIIAGASSGGAALVVRQDAGIQKAEDFHGKRVASPQLGNTQDVALREWLRAHGLKAREKGGDVQVVPVANADQLTLFANKQLDAAWAPEPWASRLIQEANGKLFLDERELWPKGQFATALLIVRTKFLQENRELVKRWLKAHLEVTEWIEKHPTEAKKILNQQIQKDAGKGLAAGVLDEAFGRMKVTYDPVRHSLLTSAKWEFDAGFLGRQFPDLSGLFDLSLLNEVLREGGKQVVQ